MAQSTDSVRRVKKEQLPRVWARLQPVAHDLLRRAGETADATYADFVWAFSIFWCVGAAAAHGLAVALHMQVQVAVLQAAESGARTECVISFQCSGS